MYVYVCLYVCICYAESQLKYAFPFFLTHFLFNVVQAVIYQRS